MARTLTVEGFVNYSTTASSHTYSAVDIGIADLDRRVVVAVALQGSAPATLDSATIGGVTADILVQTTNNDITSALIMASIPFGTTADIVVNYSASQVRGGIQAYRMIGFDATPFDTAFDNTPASGVLDLDLNVLDNGAVIATSDGAGAGTMTWIGVKEDYDFDLNTQENFSGGSAFPASAATPLTLTATCIDTTPAQLCGVAVSFRPITITRASTSAEIVQTTVDRSTYGSWSLVATYVANADATIDVIDLQSDFVYKFFWSNLIPATDAAILWIRTSPDNGSTWDAGASDYGSVTHRVTMATSPGHAVNGIQDDTEIELTDTIGTSANESCDIEVTCFDPSAVDTTKFKWEGMYFDQGAIGEHVIGAGMRQLAEAVNGVRFLFSSGNIEAGTLKVYAIKV